jgi:DNA-binding NarL/FixJ family response regulator
VIRVLVVDDHSVVREGLRRILSAAGDITVVGEAKGAREALALLGKGGCDVVLTDLSMPGPDGLELLGQLRREHPKLAVLILSMHAEAQFAVRALKGGAAGYLTKESAPEELVKAVRRVAQGRRYLSEAVAERLAERLDPDAAEPPHERLSSREFQVLRMVGLGRTVGEIAEELSLSVKTVSTYRARVLQKMLMKSNAELIAYAIRNKLTD